MRGFLAMMAVFTFGCGEAATKRTDHPDGFSFTHPVGWVVESVDGKARAFPPDQSELVAVEPVFPAPGQGARAALEALVRRGQLGPLRSPTLLSLRGDNATAEALLSVKDKKAHALLALRGGAGTLFVAGAQEAKFAARLPELVNVLKSFSLRAPKAAATPAVAFQRFEEPQEKAYSVELPAAWRTALGVFRVGALAPRFETSAVSPDGAITVFLGERNVGTFTVPTPELAQFGMREGMTYNPSGIHPTPVLRYLPGADFGRYWLGMRLQGAQATGGRQRPDLAQRLAAERYRYGNVMNARVDAGEVEFEYQGRRGRVVVATELYGGQMGVANWTLIFHAGYFAQPGREAEAEAVMAHAIGTGQPNPAWLRMERYFAKMDHEAAMNTMRATNDIFRQTMAERSESNARNARGVGDTLAGTYRVIDPTTNEYTTVQAGSNFYYRVNNTNAVFGTNQEQSPVDVTRMLRLDWDIR
jgi:hypothetical protein